MAVCPQCGRELQPSGDGTLVCPECSPAARPAPQRNRIPISEYVRRFPATSLLLSVNVLVFAAMCLGGVSPISPSVEQLTHWGAGSGEQILLNGQWWRLLTSAFVHVGALHLLMNMWALWLIGTLAEAILGTYLYVGVYLVCALAGSLTSLWWRPIAVEAGASGALMGILGALVSVLKFAHLPVPKEAARSTTRSLVQGAVLTLAIGLLPIIDNAAHVGGLLCGLLLGLLLSLTRRADYKLQRPLRHACLLLPLLLMAPLALYAKKRGEPLLHYALGLDQLRASHYPEAEREARVALKDAPTASGPLDLLSEALYRQGKDAVAASYSRQVIARDPRDIVATNILAAIELKDGDYPGARDLLIKALPLQPSNAIGRVYLGQAFEALHNDREALAQYRIAVQVSPDLYEAQMALGSMYERHGEAKDAILFYKKAAEFQPSQIGPLQGLARAYLAAGMKPQADEVIAEIRKRQQGQ